MSTNAIAATMNAALKSQTAQALVMQAYCNSVLQQPGVSFTLDTIVQNYGTQVNSGLTTAKFGADNYINSIIPNLINSLSNVSDFYTLYMALPSACPPGTPARMWVDVLTTIGQQSDVYLANSKMLISLLNTLNLRLAPGAAECANIAADLNVAVSGSAAVLQNTGSQLDSIQGQIDNAMASNAQNAIAVAGATFTSVTGAVADIAITGANVKLVMGGVALIATSGQAASAATLSGLDKQKQALLANPTALKGEVAIALGISSSYKSLGTLVTNIITAATGMQNAWQGLSTEINNIIEDLNNGILAADVVRTLFLPANSGNIATLLADVNTIQNQVAGINVHIVPGLLSATLDGIANGTAV